MNSIPSQHTLVEMLKQVPSLTVLALVVWMFLGRLDHIQEQTDNIFNQVSIDHTECHQQQQHMVNAVHEHSKVLMLLRQTIEGHASRLPGGSQFNR